MDISVPAPLPRGKIDPRGEGYSDDDQPRKKIKDDAYYAVDIGDLKDTAESEDEELSESDNSESSTGSEGSGAEEEIDASKFDRSPNSSQQQPINHVSNDDDVDEMPPVEETPPPSPVELKDELPPYLPAIQGCRSVDEFTCLNRIE